MDQQYINDFKIAELNIRIIFKESQRNSMRLLPSFEPFRAEIDSNAPCRFLFSHSASFKRHIPFVFA